MQTIIPTQPPQADRVAALDAVKVAAQLLRYGAGDPFWRISDAEFLTVLQSQRRRVVMLAGQILDAAAELETPAKAKVESEAAHG